MKLMVALLEEKETAVKRCRGVARESYASPLYDILSV
jgi:hypothetical protein